MRTGALAARPLGERIADARAVASALEAIHRAGIIHRDVSPQNLLRMADGRLVVTDFGLAVDVSESTSSIHGGTVSYMAPEVLRGGPATFASDIWGLGVVMHEMVFGMKPRWSDGANPTMLPPKLRRLTPDERAVFETCRACTAIDPADRLVREGDVARMLAECPRWWRWRRRLRPATARRPLLSAAALTLVAATAVAVMRARHRAPDAPGQTKAQTPMMVTTGESADWTDVSTVIAEVPERIVCTRLLPDKRTIRFVWGVPPRAEDIDIVTRKRVPSPLVPAAYVEGCPDLSPDGKSLVYQGHTPDGRAFAFLSERPDGKDAMPVVQTAEPSMSSEPTWLEDGQTFSYDVDTKHMGVFSPRFGHATVLPEATQQPSASSFRYPTGGLIFIAGITNTGAAEVVGVSWPALREEERWRTDDFVLDLRAEGSRLYYTGGYDKRFRQLVEVDSRRQVARRLGFIRDQIFRYPLFVGTDLAFTSVRNTADLYGRGAAEKMVRLTTDGGVFSAAHCGPDLIINRQLKDGRTVVERIDAKGRKLGVIVPPSSSVLSPGCSPDGQVLFYVDIAATGVKRCDQKGCRRLTDRSALSLSVSPDGRRLAVMTFERRGIVVWWISAEGGETHDLAEIETGCAPGWSSAGTLWIARRRHGGVNWVEVDVDTGRETGKIVAGKHDCSDARPDPASPVDPDLRIVYDQTSQLRLLDVKFLKRN
jgi:hypothetical protein